MVISMLFSSETCKSKLYRKNCVHGKTLIVFMQGYYQIGYCHPRCIYWYFPP